MNFYFTEKEAKIANWYDLPFAELAEQFESYKDNWKKFSKTKESFYTKYSISYLYIDKILAYIANNFELPKQSNSKLIQPIDYLDINLYNNLPFSKDKLAVKGFYYFMLEQQRSLFTNEPQYKFKYNILKPLFLMAHKQYNNIPYSAWAAQDIQAVVGEKLSYLMNYKSPMPLEGDYWATTYGISRDKLLKARNDLLLIKSGKASGSFRNPETTYMFYSNNILDPLGITDLVKIVAIQAWAAHISNRDNYMILCPSNWDYMPESLISDEIF